MVVIIHNIKDDLIDKRFQVMFFFTKCIFLIFISTQLLDGDEGREQKLSFENIRQHYQWTFNRKLWPKPRGNDESIYSLIFRNSSLLLKRLDKNANMWSK